MANPGSAWHQFPALGKITVTCIAGIILENHHKEEDSDKLVLGTDVNIPPWNTIIT